MPPRHHWYPLQPDPGPNPTGKPLLQEQMTPMTLPCDNSTVHTSMGSETLDGNLHLKFLQQPCRGSHHPGNESYIPFYATSAPEANLDGICTQQLFCILVILYTQITV